MLTPRENLLETLKPDGKPEYLSNAYTMFKTIAGDPCNKYIRGNRVRGTDSYDPWGTFIHFGADEPAAVPIVTEQNQVIQDLECWEDFLKVPDLEAHASTGWEDVIAQNQAVDHEKYFSMSVVPTGIFEQLHMLMTFENTLMGFLEEPEAMKALINRICDYKMTYLRLIVENLHPDAVLSHDDWGANNSMFFSRQVWKEFFAEPYKRMYTYLHDNGILVLHHADSFMEPIAGDLKEIGIDVWQGVLPTNDICKMGAELNGTLGMMGGVDSIVDQEGVDEAFIRKETRKACDLYGNIKGFWPGMTYGGAGGLFPGVYETVVDEISRYNLDHFGKDPFLTA